MSTRAILACLLGLLFALAAPGQVDIKAIEKSSPPIKLPTKSDKAGLKQWGEYRQNCPACKGSKKLECTHCKHLEDPKKCPSCKTTRKAACHYCTGKGQLPDPLTKAPCPGCRGHGVMICILCGNQGVLRTTASGKKGQKCPVCKLNAGIACTTCKGAGVVASAFRGKVGSTPLKKLENAKAQLTTLIKKVEKFQVIGNVRKDSKNFHKLFKGMTRDFPDLKKYLAQSDAINKKLNQPQLKDNAKRLAYQSELSRTNLLNYLLHQDKVLDQCIERAKFNESASKKGKK